MLSVLRVPSGNKLTHSLSLSLSRSGSGSLLNEHRIQPLHPTFSLLLQPCRFFFFYCYSIMLNTLLGPYTKHLFLCEMVLPQLLECFSCDFRSLSRCRSSREDFCDHRAISHSVPLSGFPLLRCTSYHLTLSECVICVQY